jgi:heme exporter protein A
MDSVDRLADPDTGASPMVEARGLIRRFGHVNAVDGIDLVVRRGESVALFGPNGAGKTTLIRILTSALKPSSGTVKIAQLDPRVQERETRRLVGVISHQSFLYDDLSARDNLLFFARLYGVDHPRDRTQALLESMDLAARADDPAGTFSRGMQQRLTLARCLIHDPQVVFLDEPFTGLDPQSATTLRTTLEGLRAQARTLVLVTHHLARGLELSDRWLILARGRIVDDGLSVDNEPASFEQRYLERVGHAPEGGEAMA